MNDGVLDFIEDKHKFLRKALPQHYEKYKSVIDIGLPLMLINKLFIEKKEKLFLSKYDISNSEFDVLMSLLCLSKKLTPTELYENMIFSSGGMTKLLKKLETKGLIRRVPSTYDKRSMLVELSEDGIELVIKAFDDVANMNMGIFSILDYNEKVVFEKILKKMLVKISNN